MSYKDNSPNPYAEAIHSAYAAEVENLFHVLVQNTINTVPDAEAKFKRGIAVVTSARDWALKWDI